MNISLFLTLTFTSFAPPFHPIAYSIEKARHILYWYNKTTENVKGNLPKNSERKISSHIFRSIADYSTR